MHQMTTSICPKSRCDCFALESIDYYQKFVDAKSIAQNLLRGPKKVCHKDFPWVQRFLRKS